MEEDQLLSMVSDEFTTLLWMLVKLILFAMLLERGLYFLFDYSLWRERLNGKKIKAPITLGLAWYACNFYDFDIVSPILDSSVDATNFGVLITSLVIAGGSASAMILFQDILSFSRDAQTRIKAINKAEYDKKIIDINKNKMTEHAAPAATKGDDKNA